MDQFSQPVLSKKLLTIIANSTTSTNQIIFKRAIASSDKYKLDDLSGFDDNSVTTVKKASETVFSNVTIDGNGIQLTAIFSSNGNDSNYDINTILFTAEYGGQEFLAFSQIANYSLTVPAGSSKEVFNLTLKPKIVVDSTKTISTNISPDAIATNEYVEQKTSELNSKISDIQNKQSDLLDELSEKISKSGNPQTIDTKLTFTEKINGVITGADALVTPINIGGVAFDGTADITLPGVNATGNQNTTGLANAVQSLEITSGTDLSTIKGYGGSAVYHIANGITLTSTPSDYSGKGAILKVTESGTTVYQELIDVMTDNGSWIRIIDGSTVNDWQTKGGGGVKVLSEADIPTPTYASSSYPTDRSKYTPTFSKMHIYATNNTLRLTGNLSVTGTYWNGVDNKMGYLIDTSPLLTSNTPQVALNGVLWGRRNMISTTTLVTTEVSQSLSGKMWIDYISFNGKYFYYHVRATDSIYSGTWYSGNIPIDITVTYS